MALRYAERQKSLKQLTKRDRTKTVKTVILYDGSKPQIRIELSPGISVICGGNGAGKSMVLAAIWNCLKKNDDKKCYLPLPTWLTSVETTGDNDGVSWTTIFDANLEEISEACPLLVDYSNPSADSEAISTFLRKDDNLEDLFEGLDAASFTEEQIKYASYALRRTYAKIEVVEIVSYNEDGEELPIPFFTATSGGVTYNMLNMGRGEVSAIYLLWRLGKSEKNSVWCLDEPEAHLALFSQKALLEILVEYSVKLGVQFILTSHHPDIFSLLADDAVSLISGSPQAQRIVDIKNYKKAAHLGVKLPVSAIFICEDKIGCLVCRSILRSIYPSLGACIDFKYVNSGSSGVSKIVDDLRNTGDDPVSINVFGVLDGDMRTSFLHDRLNFLPGSESPEKVFRATFNDWVIGPATLTDESKVTGSELRLALEEVEGLEDHDWMSELAKRIGGLESGISVAVSLMLKNNDLYDQAVELAEWSAEAAGVGR